MVGARKLTVAAWMSMLSLLLTLAPASARADEAPLPVEGAADKPLVLLQAENAPGTQRPNVRALPGEVVGQQGADYVTAEKEQVVAGHKGLGDWGVNFRYAPDPRLPAGTYTFWARWMQGGEPRVSAQTFIVLAGPSADRLEQRGSFQLTNDSPWKPQWVMGQTLELKEDDAIIEIRNSGQGHDAKAFDAFLLSPGKAEAPAEAPAPDGNAGASKPPPPPIDMPASGAADRPIVILGFGPAPLGRTQSGAEALVYSGTIRAAESATGSISEGAANLIHSGLGAWGGTFHFDLDRPIPPGYYTFHARYMSGGEPSQVRQTFIVKAGADEQHLGVRGTFTTLNSKPFVQQWTSGTGTLMILPGDRILQIVNSGKAHDAKVFSGFVLAPQQPIPGWLTDQKAAARSAFLAKAKATTSESPTQLLYVLDGEGPGDSALFAGLADARLDRFYAATQTEYVLGEASDALAAELNIPARPAAVLVNGDRKVLGVLHAPAGADAVVAFLGEQGRGGIIPPHPSIERSPAQTLVDGAPRHWLVASGWPGRCGVGHWGLDAEALQRPNPGDVFGYAFYTAGNRYDRWEERAPQPGGITRIVDRLPESYAWGKSTSYAVLYVHADQPMRAMLHLQHSGIQHAVYLDAVPQATRTDPSPPARLEPRPAAREQVIDRPGQEIHDDVAARQAAEAPAVAPLELAEGWHCLIVKMVHAQGKDESVVFSATFTDEAGRPIDSLRTQTTDPTVALAPARAAAGLWPLLTLDNIPGNLPRPGEPLTLVADLRIPPRSFMAAGPLPRAFLPIDATLKVRMTDYDGREIKAVQAAGSFPGVVRIDLGPAPDTGYYALIPELYAADGRLIRRFHPDGFSVVRGQVAQTQRGDAKEVMNSWYYALNEDWETFAPWLERMGLVKNVGSFPGVPAGAESKWEEAVRRGFILFGDFAGDSNWMNNSEPEAAKVVQVLPQYTRYFKGVNEIDGRFGGDEGVTWWETRNPARYVERAKAHHQALHARRDDIMYFGGSVYTSGTSRTRGDHPEILGPRQWLRKCLELGLDQYIDAWDVHAYPQQPPRLEADSISNSPNESDRGVLAVYREAGIPFNKKFLMGETSALVWHGFEGMRWQAATAAKLAAWTNSRADWLGVAFCAAHHDRRMTAEEYGMARNPGEAALYTASALIDGLPYRRAATDDPDIQAAWFGPTFMIWRSDDRGGQWTMELDDSRPWVMVDVVGRVSPLHPAAGRVTFPIATSPLYILPRADYDRLTRSQ